MPDPIWFWQRIVSPHMAGLAEALARRGRSVTYVAEEPMSAERTAQGWRAPNLSSVHVRYAPDRMAMDALVEEAPSTSINICQGFRGNGLVGSAQRGLSMRGLRQWVVMEGVEQRSWASSMIKGMEYRRLIRLWRERIQGVLAIGETTPGWVVARGMSADRTYPFTYFIPEVAISAVEPLTSSPFRVLFVGQHIERKRLGDLIDAASLIGDENFELIIAGTGPLEMKLRAKAQAQLGDRAKWLGGRPITEIQALMAQADCLVLPSRHDGWGAVVSEALMAGTPAICSNRCGSAVVVRASGRGGVFPARNVGALAGLLRQAIAEGRQTGERRAALAEWASCLGATAGAAYLEAILSSAATNGAKPAPPWHRRATRGDADRPLHVLP